MEALKRAELASMQNKASRELLIRPYESWPMRVGVETVWKCRLYKMRGNEQTYKDTGKNWDGQMRVDADRSVVALVKFDVWNSRNENGNAEEWGADDAAAKMMHGH